MDRIEQHDEQHLPPEARRFPFKALTADEREKINAAIGRAIMVIDGMLAKLARRRFPEADPETIEDITQDVATHLALHALPRYDATRHTKVSTYMHLCATRKLIDLARRRQHETPDTINNPDACPAPDVAADRAVADLVERITADPSAYFSPRQAQIITALQQHDGQAEAREALNLTPAAFANASIRAQQRAREILAEVA